MAKKTNIPAIMAGIDENKIFKIAHSRVYEKLEENLYQPVEKGKELTRIRSHLSPSMAENITTAELREMYQQLMTDERFELSREDVCHPKLMRVKNGIINVTTAKLVDDDSSVFLYRNNFSYDADAQWLQCPEFAKMLEASGITGESRTLLMEAIGFVLSECVGAKVAVFFVGPPDCGKSVLLNFIGQIVGEMNTTAMQLDKLGSRFNKARLATSRVNICTEISGDRMKDLDIFKAITSNERIMGEHKCEMPFEFTVTTKLLFAGNMLPRFPELEGADALMRRMVILRFPRSVDEIDLELSEKLWKEKDVICSIAVQNLKNLIKNRFVFTEPEDTKTIKAELRREINMFDDFIAERCQIVPSGRVHFVTLWNSFTNFCEENGYELAISKQQFSQKIGTINGVKHNRFRLKGSDPLRGFEGLALKTQIILARQDSGQ